MDKITTFLWFDNNAEEAANFYVSVFKNSKIENVTRSPGGGPNPEGSVLVVNFQLEGRSFIALNGGPNYKFTPAISLMVDCKDQVEVDELWSNLTAGGKEVQCGWLEDKYGLSWQIVPRQFFELMNDKDAEKRKRVFQAMMTMKKLNVDELKRASTAA